MQPNTISCFQMKDLQSIFALEIEFSTKDIFFLS